MRGRRRICARAVVTAAMVAVLSGACDPASTANPVPSTPPSPAEYAARLLQATNAARTAEGLPELTSSACAADQARHRLEPLLGGRELVHASLVPVTRGCAPPSGVSAENLSRTAASPGDVVDAWLGSPGHRANVLDPGLIEFGVACTVDGDGADAPMLCSAVFLG